MPRMTQATDTVSDELSADASAARVSSPVRTWSAEMPALTSFTAFVYPVVRLTSDHVLRLGSVHVVRCSMTPDLRAFDAGTTGLEHVSRK